MGDELKPWEIAAQQQAKPTSDKKPWEVAADNSQKKSDVQNTTAPILPLDNAAINSTDVAGQQLPGSNANGVLTGLENTTAKPAGYEDLPIDQSTFNKQLDNIRASRTKLNDLTTSQQNIAKDVSHIHNEQTQQLSDLINQYNAAPDKTKPVIKQQIDALKAQPFTGSKVTIPSITSMVDPMAKLGLGGGDQSTQDIEISPKTYTGSDANIPKVKTVGDAYNLLPDKNKTYTDNQAQIAQTKAEFDAARNERLRQIGLDPKNGFFNGVQTAAQMNTRANLVSHFVQNGNDAQGIKEANEYLDDMSFMQQKAQEDKVNNDSPLDIGQEYGAPKLNGMGVYNFYNSMIKPIAGALGLEAAGSLVGAPEAGNAYITYDAYNQAYTNTFLNTYQKLKEENPNDDAGNYTKAKVMAQADAKGSALVMAGGLGIMKGVEGISQLRNFAGETFAKGLTDYGVKNTAETGLEQLFSSPLAADIVPRTLGQIALHATGESAAFTGLNIAKEAHLQSVAKGLGIEEPELLEGAGGMAAFPYIMNGMMYAVGKAGEFVMGQKNPYEKWSNETKQNAVISTALTSTPEMVDQMLDKGVASGIITDNHKAILKGQIDDVRTAVGMLPKDASPDEIKAAIPLQIQINKNQALLDGEGAGNVAVDRAETENEKLTTKLHEILGSPLSVDENNTWHDLNKELKENGKLEKPDRLEFDSLSKRRDAAYNKQRAANLKRINLNQEQLPLVGSEDDRISLQDGTKYVTKEGDNYVPHIKGKDKPIADGTTTVDSTAPVGEKVSETTVTSKADDAGKEIPTKVGNVTLQEHGEDQFTADGKENGTEKNDPLTDDGVKEAENQGADLAKNNPDVQKVFHGTVQRTIETAKIVAQKAGEALGRKVETVLQPLLDTWNIGKSEGKADGSFDERAWANKPDEAPKGGESWNSFADRAKQAWDFLKSHPDNDHAIASSKMERMLSSLNETNGDVEKAKEVYFKKLENDKQATDSQKGAGQVQSDGTTGKKEGDGTGGGLPNGEEKEVGGNDNPPPPKKEKATNPQNPGGDTGISKSKIKDKYDKVFEHESVSVQQKADEARQELEQRASDKGIAPQQEAANHVNDLINTDKGIDFKSSAYDILTTTYHLSNLETDLADLEGKGNEDAITAKKAEIDAVNDLILQKLGRTSGENLNLFGSVFKKAEDGTLLAARDNFAKALNIEKMPMSEAELDGMIKDGMPKSEGERIRPYVKAIADYKTQLEAERTAKTKINTEHDKAAVEKYIKDEVARQLKLSKPAKVTGGKITGKAADNLRSYAQKIRESKTLDKFGLGKAPDDVTALGVTFDVKEALAKTLEHIADGIDKAEAIGRVLKEYGVKANKDFADLVDKALSKSSLPDKDEVLGKIKDMASAVKGTGISKSIVDKGLIHDVVNDHIHNGEKADEVLKNSLADIKKVLPDADIHQLTDAILRKGEYKAETKTKVENAAKEATKDVNRLSEKISKEHALSAADDIHTIEQDNTLSKEEKKAAIEKRKTAFEKELDEKIAQHEQEKRDAANAEKKKTKRAEAEEKRVQGLKDELDRIQQRKAKEAKETGTKPPIERSEREKELLKEIDKSKKQWDAEKEKAKQNKIVAEKLLAEKNRQAKVEVELNKKIAEAKQLFRAKNPTAKGEPDTPQIEALKQKLADTRKDTAAKERQIMADQRLADKVAEINKKTEYVKAEKKIFESGIKNRPKSVGELAKARAELKQATHDAGLRLETKNKADIKTAQEFEGKIQKVKDSDLSQSEKNDKVADLEKQRDDLIGHTKQGVLANLKGNIDGFVDELNSKHEDAIASGDTEKAKELSDLKDKLNKLSDKTRASSENAKDRIDQSDQALQQLIKDYKGTEHGDRLQDISDNNRANWDKTADELKGQSLLDAAKQKEREIQRKLTAQQYTEIPTAEHDVSRDAALSAQQLKTQKAAQQLKGMQRKAADSNRTWLDTVLMVRAKMLIASLSAIEKVGISTMTKPIMDTLIKQSFGRLTALLPGAAKQTELRNLGKTFRPIVMTTEGAKEFVTKANMNYVNSIKAYDTAKENFPENSKEVHDAKNDMLKAEFDKEATFPYLFINSNSALDFKDIMLHGATDFDEQIGDYNKSYAKDRTKIQELGHWLDGINRTHGALKSISAKQAGMNDYMENLQYFQKTDGQITPESRQQAFDLAFVDKQGGYKAGKFQEQTALSDKIAQWKASDNPLIRYPAKFTFPVSKIAINIAKQSIDIALPAEAILRSIRATQEGIKLNKEDGETYSNFASKWGAGLNKGVESLNLDQKKYLGNLVAKGAFGLTQYVAVGFLLGSGALKYGGAYDPFDPFKDKHGKVMGSDGTPLKNGEWEISGYRLPKLANVAINHAPYFLPASLAAMTTQQYQREDYKGLKNVVADILSGNFNEVLERLPFTGAIDLMLGLTGSEYNIEHGIADIPPNMRNLAQMTDKDAQGNPIRRDTNAPTFGSRVFNIWKSNMPGLNKTLPQK